MKIRIRVEEQLLRKEKDIPFERIILSLLLRFLLDSLLEAKVRFAS
jgi:hypothetical protein